MLATFRRLSVRGIDLLVNEENEKGSGVESLTPPCLPDPLPPCPDVGAAPPAASSTTSSTGPPAADSVTCSPALAFSMARSLASSGTKGQRQDHVGYFDRLNASRSQSATD
jgi:hypothetical protein